MTSSTLSELAASYTSFVDDFQKYMKIHYLSLLSDTSSTAPDMDDDHATIPTGRLRDALTAIIISQGFTLFREDLPGEARGATDQLDKEVVILPTLSGVEEVKVFAHELSHILLHQAHSEIELVLMKLLENDVIETEAALTAYLVLTAFGYNVSEEAMDYIGGWIIGYAHPQMATPSNIRRRALTRIFTPSLRRRVIAAAYEIIEAVREHEKSAAVAV